MFVIHFRLNRKSCAFANAAILFVWPGRIMAGVDNPKIYNERSKQFVLEQVVL